MAKKETVRKKLVIKHARLSFPNLFETEVYNGKDTEKYTATFLIPKDSDEAKKAIKAFQAAMQEAGIKVPKSKWALQDGDEKDYNGYEGHYSLKASLHKSRGKPVVIGKGNKKVTSEDDEAAPYAGCYVDAIVYLWVQDNQWGKRINAELAGVRFVEDGEPLGGSGRIKEEDVLAEFGIDPDELEEDDDTAEEENWDEDDDDIAF